MRAKVTIRPDVLGDVFFRNDPSRLGRFLNAWMFAVERNDPTYFAHPDDDNDRTRQLAKDCRWVIEGRRGHLYLTGPDRVPMWLRRKTSKISTYVIEAVGTGTVKIGKSGDVRARIAQLQTSNANELRLIANLRGDVERMLHSHLVDHRVTGEWFRWTPEVQAAIDLLDKADA